MFINKLLTMYNYRYRASFKKFCMLYSFMQVLVSTGLSLQFVHNTFKVLKQLVKFLFYLIFVNMIKTGRYIAQAIQKILLICFEIV